MPLASFSSTLTSLIGDHGIYAVFILMVIDAVLPAASELVMLYAGVVASGALPGQDVVLFGHQIDSHFWAFVAMSMAGVLGNTVGSVIGWGIGYYGGRPLIEKRGRWLHLGPEKLDRAESWFARWGDWAVCLGRVTPVVRSFVSIPAGVARMPLGGSRSSRSSAASRGASAWRASAGPSARATSRSTTTSGSSTSRSACSSWPWSPSGSSVDGGHLDWAAVPQIPLVDVKAQYAPLLDELKERIADVLDSGRFILGPNVQAFEEEAAAYLGVEHAIGVANGTDALVIALDALGIGPGDEVICPTFTFYATAESIARRGATPVFAEIDAQTMNFDPEDVRAGSLRRRRRSSPCTCSAVPRRSATWRSWESRSSRTRPRPSARRASARPVSPPPTASSRPRTCSRSATAASSRRATRTSPSAIRLLRFHGSKAKKDFELVGYNSRLDELQAAVLRLFLPHLDEWNRLRREAAARYGELGLGEVCELPADEPGHVYHVYVVRTAERDRIREHLHPRASARPRTTRPRSTCSRPCAASAIRKATSPRPSAPRVKTSRFRCGRGSARRCRNRWSRP